MAMHAPRLDDPGEEDALGDGRPTLLEWAKLVLSAASRRKVIAACIFFAGASASAAYYMSLETRYRVEARILTQRPQALPSAVRAVFEEQPTRSAWDLMHRRESLIALVRRAKLLPGRAEPPLDAASSGAAVVAAGRTSGDEALETLLALLGKRLVVDVEDGTITISVEWSDPEQAYEIVQGAVENFLEARHIQEITAIDEVISVLQGRAATLRTALDAALVEARRPPASAHIAPVPRAHAPSEELVRLQSLLEAKQRAIRDVEELRLRRVADLQAQVDRARNTLSDAHPAVIGLRKDLEAASRESPQIVSLREDERNARKEYVARLAREGFNGPSARPVAQPLPATPAATPVEEDPGVKHARTQYDQIAARLNAAQVERDAARAAFKYRYSVIWPPQLPTQPVSPSAETLGAALLASVLLALGAAAAPDLWAGRIVQRWQLERALGLPIMGEIRRRR